MAGFKEYKSTKFTPYILPVIPKGEPLAATCTIEPERIGKIPGRRNAAGEWNGFHLWQKHTASDSMLDGWARWYPEPLVETVCLQTRAFTALDSDADDAFAASIIDAVALKIFGPGPVRKRPGSEKFLRLYRFGGGVPIMKRKQMFTSPTGKLLSYEICGDGQQVLLEGSHPNGTCYYWVDDVTPRKYRAENLTEVTNEQVNQFIVEAKAMLEAFGYVFTNNAGAMGGTGQTTEGRSDIGPDHPDQCPDLADLVNWLAKCPCDSPQFADRDQWFNVVLALKAASGGDEAFFNDHVLPWAAVVDGNTEEYMQERWDSIYQSSFGWSYLLAVSQDIDPTVLGSLFTDLTGALSEADVGTPPPALASVVRPDERAIAEKFVEEHAHKRWLVAEHLGKLYQWFRNDEGIWVRDGMSMISDISAQCARVSDVIRANPNATTKQQTLADSLQGYTKARHVTNLVMANPRMHLPVTKMDEKHWLLGFKGGYVDRKNVLRPADPSLYITKRLLVIPDFGAPCPMWDAHMALLCKGDETWIEALMRWWGYCYSGTGQEQKFLFFWGAGGVGVTTTLEALGMLGGDYANAVSHTIFMRNSDGARFGLSTLAGKWFVYTSEIDKSEEWADATLVTATGSGKLPIEEKNMPHRTIDVQCGINFQGNQLPRFRRIDRAIRRRTQIAKFEGEKIEDIAKVDKGYFRRLVAAEGPAILARVLEARARYDRDGLILPEAWKREADTYFDSIDKKKLWREERLVIDQDSTITGQQLFEDYRAWHAEGGHGPHAGTKEGFMHEMKNDPWMRANGVRFDRKRVNTVNPISVVIGLRLVCQACAGFDPLGTGKF
jgi:P4 family phage/plasmid primase-like protien